jgi:hypothetical protein
MSKELEPGVSRAAGDVQGDPAPGRERFRDFRVAVAAQPPRSPSLLARADFWLAHGPIMRAVRNCGPGLAVISGIFGLSILALVGARYGRVTQPASVEIPSLAPLRSGDVFEISVSRNGVELDYEGDIPEGASAAVARGLAENPGVRIFRLNGDGGLVYEAMQIRRMIHERAMVTFTSTRCLSACALAFIGGRVRYLGPGAVLGFHRFRSDVKDDARLESAMDAERRRMADLGLSPLFAVEAMSAPSSEMWFPSVEELVAAHVIDGVRSSEDLLKP